MRKQLLQVMAFVAVIVCTCCTQASAQSWNITGNANATATSILGTTNAIPLNLTTNNVSRIVIDANGKIGVNTAPGLSFMTLKGAGGTPASSWISSGAPLLAAFGEASPGNADLNLSMAAAAANARGVYGMKRARGTLAAPAAVLLNDQLGSLLATGFDGTNFQASAAVDFFADGTPTAGHVPARISFVTGTTASDRTERFKILSGGDVSATTGNFTVAAGNLNMGSAAKTIQFATPVAGSAPMITMFPSGTQNADRMVISHSPYYTNYGLQYQDSLDKFNFLSNGNPVLTADLTYQRVGVGTSSPAARLDIAGTGAYNLATGTGDFRLGDAAYNLKMGVANAGGGAGDAYISGTNHLYLGAGSTFDRTQTMSINSDGQVGIGTYSPSAKLQIVGDTGTTATTLSVNPSYVGNAYTTGIYSYTVPNPGYGYGVRSYGGYIGGYFNGNGGAGTGAAYGVYAYASGTAGTRYGVYGSASGGTVDNWGGYFPTKTYTSELRVGGTAGATGYVAAINGKLIATEVRVEAITSWPDYVFGKDHILMSIEELQARINADKHLPGVPSAADVKENGIMLGDMQTKTMEKVEENTLYIIQLNEKIKLLEKKIDELTKGSK